MLPLCTPKRQEASHFLDRRTVRFSRLPVGSMAGAGPEVGSIFMTVCWGNCQRQHTRMRPETEYRREVRGRVQEGGQFGPHPVDTARVATGMIIRLVGHQASKTYYCPIQAQKVHRCIVAVDHSTPETSERNANGTLISHTTPDGSLDRARYRSEPFFHGNNQAKLLECTIWMIRLR